MAPTIVVLGVCWTACKDYCRAVPRVAARERCAVPHVAPGDLCAAPHDVPRGRYAAVHAVPYQTLERLVLQRLVLERLVMAAPEPQHLTSLASWLAPQSLPRPLVREGKTRLGAR